MVRAVAVLGALFALAPFVGGRATTACAQAPLADSDLVVAGVPYRADTITVKRLLGRPQSRREHMWRYRRLEILVEEGTVRYINILRPGLATRRGLQVGDPEERIAALYGYSCVFGAYVYTVGSCDSDPGLGDLVVTVEEKRVTAIGVGLIRIPTVVR
jgi:hypothetical protein